MREELEKCLRYLEEQMDELAHFEKEIQSASEEFEQVEYRNRMQYAEQLEYAERIPFLRELLTEQQDLILEADRSYRDMQEEMRSQIQKQKRSCEEEKIVCRRDLEKAGESGRDREE